MCIVQLLVLYKALENKTTSTFHEAESMRKTTAVTSRAFVTSSLEARVFSRGGGRVFPANPRDTEGRINSAPQRIPRLCSSSVRKSNNKELLQL